MICWNETRMPLRVNFGRGGMNKIVEEEDVQHVDAMHYVVIAGIRVGWENLKPIETRVEFWPTVFECEKKGRIDSEDLELAGRNVKRVTGWADPVDNITTFVEVVCDNYKALVDKKRKRTTDEDGVSKLPNTRSREKEGIIEDFIQITQEDTTECEIGDGPNVNISEWLIEGKSIGCVVQNYGEHVNSYYYGNFE
jgi:ABC-type taurine transport system substrate-binding protein